MLPVVELIVKIILSEASISFAKLYSTMIYCCAGFGNNFNEPCAGTLPASAPYLQGLILFQ